MSYIKINKPSLDYHQFADFHAFTMNNFIRSIMRNGKYKKASRIARLGLLLGLKKVHFAYHHKYVFDVFFTFKRLKNTNLDKQTIESLDSSIIQKLKNFKKQEEQVEYQHKKGMKNSILNDNSVLYYSNLTQQISSNTNFSFFNYFNKLIKIEDFDEAYKNEYQKSPIIIDKTQIANNFQLPLQHKIFSKDLQFKKIYTKVPQKWFFKTRNLTVFDMIIQAYTMLTGIWYMRKIKVSGRTVLVPSPLRPYRRISTVTQMLLKGIRKLRKEERAMNKKAMINSIGAEFYFLVTYYGWQYRHPNITASHVWQLKLQSHKELVANLKNIKNFSYY